jgi:hypothetical protein
MLTVASSLQSPTHRANAGDAQKHAAAIAALSSWPMPPKLKRFIGPPFVFRAARFDTAADPASRGSS